MKLQEVRFGDIYHDFFPAIAFLIQNDLPKSKLENYAAIKDENT
jgi:hypothetical protein